MLQYNGYVNEPDSRISTIFACPTEIHTRTYKQNTQVT